MNAEIVLLNTHVIENIFNRLDLQSLLRCRLVCRIWREESSRLIQRGESLALAKGSSDILRLMECLKHSQQCFPFSSFFFQLSTEDVKTHSASILELLQLLEESVRRIKFHYEMPTTSLEGGNSDMDGGICECVIGNQFTDITLPNLKSLHLFSTNIFRPQDPSHIPCVFNYMNTPNLKCLGVQSLYPVDYASIVTKLLHNSQQQVLHLRMPPNEFHKIIPQVNLISLKTLDVSDLFHGSFATNETIRCIKASCPHLEDLSIELGIRISSGAVFSMLEILGRTLKSLKLIIQDKNFLSRTIQSFHLRFPQMKELHRLFLRYANPGLIYYIEEMPKLEILELETPWTRKIRGNIFPGVDCKSYNQITTLNLSEKLRVEDIRKVHELFPNLKFLGASFINDEAIREVFDKLKNLRSLLIDRNSRITDAGLCGLPEELFYKNDHLNRDDISEEVIHSPSIADLTRLECLKLIQPGLTWKSLLFGVRSLSFIKTLSIQVSLLKPQGYDLISDPCMLNHLNLHHPKLRKLSLWIRRSSDRLKQEETEFIKMSYPHWQVEETIQSVCNVYEVADSFKVGTN